MMENIMLIHLESLNWINYKLNESQFTFLHKLEKKSIIFRNFFSTATSTFMVLGDLAYGSKYQYESCKTLQECPGQYLYDISLFDEEKQKKKEVHILAFPFLSDVEPSNKKNIVGFKNFIKPFDSYEDFMGSIEESIQIEPFTVFVINAMSNISLNKVNLVPICQNKDTDLKRGYIALDNYVKDIFKILDKHDKLKKTTVILYGDHGDDYWTHGLHYGYSHAIEPNNLLIHTPLFIWNMKQKQSFIVHEVYDTHDIYSFIKDISENTEGDLTKLKLKKEGYSISRNAYAAQPIRENSFNKAYSIVDGEYLLMVSHKGLVMYNIEMDFSCHHNLLKYYELHNGYLIDQIVPYRAHIASFMNKRQRQAIRQKFYYLHGKLYEETLKLYTLGNKNQMEMNSEMKFNEINYD